MKTMLHELKLAGEYEDSLEERVARLLTNDFGETLRTEVSYSLLQEFKKFMFLIALDILETKRKGDFHAQDIEEDKRLNKVFYVSPYSPPYFIDLVWRFLIQEGKIYSDFCNSIWGGYIDRPNPNVDHKSTLTRYESARLKLEELDGLIKPYWGLWPSLTSTDQLTIDYDHDMLFHTKEKVNQLLELADKVKEQAIDEFQIVVVKHFIEDWRNGQLHNLEDLEEVYFDEDADISKYCKRKGIRHSEIYHKLEDFEFHPEFISSIWKMFMLSREAGNKFIAEYKNFLFMYYLTEWKWAPSFEIDCFWDLHYASTKDYRKFCYDIFGEFLPSKNYDYNEKGIKRRTKDYQLSLEFYEVLFGSEPNEILWESAVDLTINSKNGFQHVNLFKYVCLCIYSNTNGGFEYKNTFRRNKDTAYDQKELEQILEKNKIKLKYAKGNNEFVQLSNHRTVAEDESIDEDEEREEAEKLVEEVSVAQSEIYDVDEHPRGNDYKLDRLKEAISQRGGKAPSRGNSSSEDDINIKNDRSSVRLEDDDRKVIYDPVLTKGGFKILPQYHNTLIFDTDDLIDRIENGIYKDYIHKGSKKFKDIFDVAILSRADADILFLPGLTKNKKKEIGIHELLLDLKQEDTNFEFDPNEKFKPKKETVFENRRENIKKEKSLSQKESSSEEESYHSSEQSDSS